MKKVLEIILILLFSLTLISCSPDDTEEIHEPIQKAGDTIGDVVDPVADVVDDTVDVVNDGLEEVTSGGGDSSTEDISISSSASDNATVAFGQSYQYQVTTSGTYSGTLTYSLSNQPDGMTISSTGLIEWTPQKPQKLQRTQILQLHSQQQAGMS